MYRIKVSKNIRKEILKIMEKRGKTEKQLRDAGDLNAHWQVLEEFEKVRKEFFPEWHIFFGDYPEMYRIQKWKNGKYKTKEEAEKIIRQRVNEYISDLRWYYDIAEGFFGSAD